MAWIQEAAELLQRWGLVMREQLPVPESSSFSSLRVSFHQSHHDQCSSPRQPSTGKLKHRVDPDEMVREGLIVPWEPQTRRKSSQHGLGPFSCSLSQATEASHDGRHGALL